MSASDLSDSEIFSDNESLSDEAIVSDVELDTQELPVAKEHKIINSEADGPTVVYIGHLPHGFYELQLKEYFEQFGHVKNVRVSRNKQTGRSKHYAFVEFDHPEVAAIVQETMDGYFIHRRLLQCRLVDPKDVHPSMFINNNHIYKPANHNQKYSEVHNRQRTQTERKKRVQKMLERERKRQELIEASGINYTFENGISKLVNSSKKENNKKSKKVEVEKLKKPDSKNGKKKLRTRR
eukprot:TRINITY_DN3131_c1_g3_i1.p1 TRINITY_DN3131_c1_g3~~TRINITY_DN3131_c1_g3_i1.p1  ORF type:complete len:237 (+),score=77.15 TRINITY_DN3131_c1_g3_i1:766-1476(+)